MVSVVVCTYNREKYILDCLESLAEQTADPSEFEIVIVNNNSTDSTDSLVREFIDRHPHLQIRYVFETKQGLSHARNRGIDESKGDYISFIDDDAIAEKDNVRQIEEFFRKYQDAMAVGGQIFVKFEGEVPKWQNRFSDSLVTGSHHRGDTVHRYRNADFPFGSNMNFRRTYFDQYPRFNVDLGRIGKNGLAAEEKEVFSTMRKHNIPYYYDPSIIVYHQVDEFRVQPEYVKKLSMALGRSRWIMGTQAGILKITEYSLEMLIKFVGAFLLGIGYLLCGNRHVLPHLMHFRWNVIRGFVQQIFVKRKS